MDFQGSVEFKPRPLRVSFYSALMEPIYLEIVGHFQNAYPLIGHAWSVSQPDLVRPLSISWSTSLPYVCVCVALKSPWLVVSDLLIFLRYITHTCNASRDAKVLGAHKEMDRPEPKQAAAAARRETCAIFAFFANSLLWADWAEPWPEGGLSMNVDEV